MTNSLDPIIAEYRQFFEQLTDARVEDFRRFAAPGVRYRDPFVNSRRVAAAPLAEDPLVG